MPFAAVHTHTKKTFISRFSKRKHISVDGNTVEPAISDRPKSEHFNSGRLRDVACEAQTHFRLSLLSLGGREATTGNASALRRLTGRGRLRELNHSRGFFREVFLTDILFGREFIACNF